MNAAQQETEPDRLAGALPVPPEFAWVELPSGVPTDGLIGREISLVRIGPTITVTQHGHDGAEHEYLARGRGDADNDALFSLISEDGHVAAFVKEIDATGGWIRLGIYELAGRYHWGGLRVGVDEVALRAVRRIAGANNVRGVHRLLEWLSRQLTFPSSAGPRRLIAILAPGQDGAGPISVRLRGDGIAAQLSKSDGEWRLEAVHRDASPVRDGDRVAIVHADVELFDATVKTRLRHAMRDELTRFKGDERDRTFLALWQRYHEMENRQGLRRMADYGHLQYSGWSYLDDAEDIIRFTVVGDGKAFQRIHDELDAGQEVQLECATELPEALGGAARTAEPGGLLEQDLAHGNEVGTVLHMDASSGVVDIRMVRRHRSQEERTDRGAHPPRQGFLHIAVWGDRRRLERRQRALRRLLNGHVPLPQLLLLLQGIPERGKEPGRRIPPMSEAAAKCFKKPPNEMQKLALETALNTPDVAVIQGPPGTGKTQLIAALQVRLAEERRRSAVVSRSMLLTSYQHAAVDNLVERSTVRGLPALKIDSQDRGSTAHIERWRTETITALKRDLSGTAEGRLAAAIRLVARRTAAYCASPVAAEDLAQVVGEVAGIVDGLVSDPLRERLEALGMELRTAERSATFRADSRRESTLRAVRGIRCVPVAFTDDGPQMAATALQHLRQLAVGDETHLDLIERAADWTAAEPPGFLGDLAEARDQLLDRLTGGADRLVRPAVREDVVDLLNDVIEDLEARRGADAEGVESALVEFLDELEGDPEAVMATLRLYTTSLAATCQQADSRAVREAKDEESLFDTVIVDEAARANPLDLLIPLTLAARRVILVGDQNQLPHMLEPDVERELRIGEDSILAMLQESLFGRMFTLLHEQDTGGRRAVRLNDQYRMHSVLGDFVGKHFYGGDLKSPRGTDGFTHDLDGYQERPAAWLNVPHSAGGEHAGKSKARPVEARVVAAELRRHVLARPDLTFGVISFYSAQVRLIWEELVRVGLAEPEGAGYRTADEVGDRLHVGTVDAFQGKEFDVVFLSTTRSSPIPEFAPEEADAENPRPRYERWVKRAYGHLLLPNRLCVAMSRQQRLLVVVGDDAMFTNRAAPPGVRPFADFRALCSPGSMSGILLGERS
ncbi:DEAD/DEAH box helicase [Actinomadura bangladeshensis]|uniref:AAA+ ATPase domain-containing protein n=1 Tax=Actinomadura bangladeshensis TaxID=453573 RepID=A0A4R4P430_9ACTN|nr:AAA domain-containing protein [Actinomadura bangladeshensis]TDC15513.1 hypothetical protein E1284_15220 [Actinomadura bangladeshensis]